MSRGSLGKKIKFHSSRYFLLLKVLFQKESELFERKSERFWKWLLSESMMEDIVYI
jgi:uncharacterized membrane protein YbaN (DUF454 family)